MTDMYYNDNDPFACTVLRARIADGRLPHGDVDERSIADVEPAAVVGRPAHFFAGIGGFPYGLRLGGVPDDLYLWTGGFPCQDLSSAGTNAGIAGPRSGLYQHILRLLRAAGDLGPDYLLLENVAVLRKRGLGVVLGDLAACGYDAEWQCVPAAAVGAPHLRDRIWIVAYPDHAHRRRRRPISAGLAYGADARGPEAGDRSGPRRQDGRAEAVADPDRQRYRSADDPVRAGRDGALDGSTLLADAQGVGRERAGTARRGRDGSADGGQSLAESLGQRLEGIFTAGPTSGPTLGSGGAGWEAEPGVGRTFNGISVGLDGSSTLKSEDTVQHATTEITRSRETLQELRNKTGTQNDRRPTRGHGSVQAPEVLRPDMREQSKRSKQKHVSPEGAETHQGELRSLRSDNATDSTPYRREIYEQRSDEPTNSVQEMPRFLESDGETTVLGGTWSDAIATLSEIAAFNVWGEGWERDIERIAHGLPARLVRSQLHAYGNAVVPQVVALIGRAIMAHRARLTNLSR